MIVKYNRTSTIQQDGNRFELDKDNYDLVLFDKGVSGSVPFGERPEGSKLMNLVKTGVLFPIYLLSVLIFFIALYIDHHWAKKMASPDMVAYFESI